MMLVNQKLIRKADFLVLFCLILAIDARSFDIESNEIKDEQKSTANLTEIASEMLKKMDRNIEPCDDFYQYACGGFLNSTVISDDQVTMNSFSQIHDKVQEQLKIILEEPSLPDEIRPFLLAKNFYKTCMNETTIEDQRLKPLQEIIKKLGGWPLLEGVRWNKSQFNWVETYAKSQKLGYDISYFLDIQILPDEKTTSKRVIYENHGNENPQRLYSLSRGIEMMFAYVNYTIEIALMLGAEPKSVKFEAFRNLFFLSNLNNISDIPDEMQNRNELYNPMTISELEKKYPTISWKNYFNQLFSENKKIDDNEVIIITRPKYIKDLEELIERTDKRVVANYMMWKIVEKSIPLLFEDYRQIEFNMYSMINGYSKNEARWKKCVGHVMESFSLSSGALYVRKYFNNDAKKNGLEIVTEIQNRYIKMLSNVSWMDNETKKHALEKAMFMSKNVGYFDELLDNSKLEEFYKDLNLSDKSFLEQYLKTSVFQNNYGMKILREPVDKNDWISHDISSQVNAYYSLTENTMVFPVGIFQGTFYNKDRPRYMNYGSIGYIIGHEITHGFDDSGRQYNKDGNLLSWWTPSTEDNFNKTAKCFVDQYGNYTFDRFNTTLEKFRTLGENIADNGGIKVAYLAYLDWAMKNGPEEKLLNLDFSPMQMFWISAAQSWCTVYRPESFMSVLTLDTHSPAELRVRGPFSNMPEFAQDFNCPLNSKMNPQKKCSIW